VNITDFEDVEPGKPFWVNTNHANIPPWAYKQPRVEYVRRQRGTGYLDVRTPDGQLREIHPAHLRKSAPGSSERNGDGPSAPVIARPRTLTGAVHRIAPEHGIELTIFDELGDQWNR